jgi:CRISPR/Cas system-associated exonuclease Cas4 (RecB family)
LRVDRYAPEAPKPVAAGDDESQLALFTVENGSVSIAEAPKLPELVPVPEPPENRVRRLSYSALALFEMCSYRFYAERIVGLRETKPAFGDGDREPGLAATEIGDMAHVILEGLDLADPQPPEDLADVVRARYATATDEEVARIGSFVTAYCASEIARRLAGLPGATVERSFAFEHDGVLLHGRLDVFHEADGNALVVDYKTNVLEDASPAEVVEREYRLQRLVYALAALRAGATEVEVVYQFLEAPEDVVSRAFTQDDVADLERELGAVIARIREGEFRPTPSDFACSGCPALDRVCAGPRLGSEPDGVPLPELTAAG